MTKLAIHSFRGEVPRTASRLLQNEQASQAVNCRLESGDLMAWREPGEVATLPGRAKTMYLAGGVRWLWWDRDVDVVTGTRADDMSHTLYFTGLDAPRITDASMYALDGDWTERSFKLGVPAPERAPRVKVSGGDGDTFAISYVVTHVTARGEEGPPSPASDVLDVRSGSLVTVSGFSEVPADRNITARRVYRAVAASSGTSVWLLAGEIAVGVASWGDTMDGRVLGTELSTDTFYPPPEGLRGLTVLGNKTYAGFDGYHVWLSEPLYPHAWPPEYTITLDAPVVGLGVIGSTLVAATKDRPYLITGSHPASMSVSHLPERQACVSKNGLVGAGVGVVFPTPDGLYLAGPSGGSLVTESLFTRDDWQALTPQSMRAAVHDGRYIVFFERTPKSIRAAQRQTGDTFHSLGRINARPLNRFRVAADDFVGFHLVNSTLPSGLILDMRNADPVLTAYDDTASAVFTDAVSDRLYYARPSEDGATTTIHLFEGSSERLQYTWRSKTFLFSARVTFGAARIDYETEVESSDESLTFTLFVDGQSRYVRTLEHSCVFRLPGGYAGREWAVELAGNVRIRSVELASTVVELTT
ncbi:hypothetical protein [Desulfovibrio inopinatus]|uniref:hypothetical protein n=1 Tax=Desulfovibrio inopinatus TaxID=102109 RepID=UPI0004891983|nr:hypothetical protein [Desulfovibrio inopinatus]